MANMEDNTKKTTTLGLEENMEGALCYSLGLITGILVLLIEKQSRFVRFHAIQSTMFFLTLFLIQILSFMLFTFASLILSPLIVFIEVVLWIFLMYKAYRGERYKLPVFGDFSERLDLSIGYIKQAQQQQLQIDDEISSIRQTQQIDKLKIGGMVSGTTRIAGILAVLVGLIMSTTGIGMILGIPLMIIGFILFIPELMIPIIVIAIILIVWILSSFR